MEGFDCNTAENFGLQRKKKSIKSYANVFVVSKRGRRCVFLNNFFSTIW